MREAASIGNRSQLHGEVRSNSREEEVPAGANARRTLAQAF